MKTLYLVRHAKSSWEKPQLSDEERPLLEKGKKRTQKMIDYLLKTNAKMDLIISSHAFRARKTAEFYAQAFEYPADQMKTDKMIYKGGVRQLANLFSDIPDEINHLWIVGHNPTITEFANLFLEEKFIELQTSGIVSIHFETDNWETITDSKSHVNFIMYPRKLKQLSQNK